jgi:hypothetical protein
MVNDLLTNDELRFFKSVRRHDAKVVFGAAPDNL